MSRGHTGRKNVQFPIRIFREMINNGKPFLTKYKLAKNINLILFSNLDMTFVPLAVVLLIRRQEIIIEVTDQQRRQR